MAWWVGWSEQTRLVPPPPVVALLLASMHGPARGHDGEWRDGMRAYDNNGIHPLMFGGLAYHHGTLSASRQEVRRAKFFCGVASETIDGHCAMLECRA